MSLFVTEIFHSIQGESLLAGRPCVFIRLSGCNLRCTYCDTTYAYEQNKQLSIRDIIGRIDAYNCALVEVTGGEPLFQEETPLLIQQLLAEGYETLMETNGSFDIDRIDGRCIRIVDVKCPSSGEKEKNDFSNLARLTSRDQLKFVIGNRKDYAYAKHILKQVDSRFPKDQILFSPVFGQLSPSDLAAWLLEDRLQTRLHLQLHRIIWPDTNRGI